MIILLYGPDTYRARQKLKEIVDQHKKLRESGLNLRYFDAQEDDLQELLDWLKQAPMFGERKLVVLKNAMKHVGNFKKFAKSEDILLFLEEGPLTAKKPLAAKAQKFDFLKGPALRKWIKSEFDKLGAEAQAQAVEKLIEFAGSDAWLLSNEIKKLAAYKKRAWDRLNLAQSVGPEDVELLVRPKIETDIFRTVRALAYKNKKQALEAIHKHLEKGEHPLYLLAMIAWQFRRLLTQRKSHLFTQQEFKKIYQKILETDLNIKTGKLEAETALTLLIAEI